MMPPIFEEMQIRMAEVIFRPMRVLKSCWSEGRSTCNRYSLAGLTVFVPALGFGAMLSKGLSSDAFRLDREPTLIFNIGLIFVTVWLAFTMYAGFMAVAAGLIGTVRRSK